MWTIETPDTVQVFTGDSGVPAVNTDTACRGQLVCHYPVTGSAAARVRVSIDGTSIAHTVEL